MARRKRKAGKRITNQTRDGGGKPVTASEIDLAVEYAINLLARVICAERYAVSAGTAPVLSTEDRVRAALEAVPSVEDLRERGTRDPEGFEVDARQVRDVVARTAGTLVHALTKEDEQAQKQERYRGLYVLLTGDDGGDPLLASARDEEIDRRRREIDHLKQQAMSSTNDAERIRLMGEAGARAAIMKAKPKNETELRAAIASALSVDERTIRRLEESTGLRLGKLAIHKGKSDWQS